MMAEQDAAAHIGPDRCGHPNDVDRRRIERALAHRARYRYVRPTVRAAACGYCIESPCCSRHVDDGGATILIAWIEFVPASGCWRLYWRDHAQQAWRGHAEYVALAALLGDLNTDRARVFWP
ncbi:MAG: DUF3024 domain-containing protein [Gammaproteobacteria bacterium]|nr:DUF3024 domain-containing protein [Gammaproteobacteria bacterium]